jgi:putative hemolysin
MLSFFQPENFSLGIVAGMLVVILLLLISALVSGSEVAYFSLVPAELDKIQNSKSRASRIAESLLKHPDRLLATILITNNFVNVGIVILSSFITSSLFNFGGNQLIEVLVKVVVITFLILFFSEVLPKVYANKYAMAFALFTAPGLLFFAKVFKPLSLMLISSTNVVNKRLLKKKGNLSMDELSDALELTEGALSEERKILQGIVKFGNIDVNDIMCPRVDVISIEKGASYSELLKLVRNSGYSRIPVYEDTFDEVKGILYIKDLLPHLDKNSSFEWTTLIRPPFFVPESKKINDLLREFQLEHIHMAIVVDEYGGTSGIVTLEDILEEIVGEISDESDAEELSYKIIDENNIVFEGKVLLNDFYKITNVEDDIFDEVKGDADTLAGLILELRGEFPKKDDKLAYKNFIFHVKEVDQRRIKLIHVTIKRRK